MIQQVSPEKIINFISSQFGLMKDLFHLSQREKYIQEHILVKISENKDVKPDKLVQYKIIKQLGTGEYQIQQEFYNLMAFLLNEFRLDMPERIAKYTESINALFSKLKESQETNEIIEVIHALIDELTDFQEIIARNTERLLKEARDLKANIAKLDYRDKVIKARYLIKHYIEPMNKILGKHHEAFAEILQQILKFSNKNRLSEPDRMLRFEYEKLTIQSKFLSDMLIRHSSKLTGELLPLLDRISTESEILSGFIMFLGQDYSNPYPPPNIFKAKNMFTYRAIEEAYAYAEQKIELWRLPDSVEFDISQNVDIPEIFNADDYLSQLLADLPVDDFFYWCVLQLETDKYEFSEYAFFSLSSLLFNNNIIANFHTEKTVIQFNNYSIKFPKISLKHV